MKNKSNEYMSYENGRKCKHCNKPLPDHLHATILYCEDEPLPDGSIKSCKNDYHAEKNRIENQPYNDLKNYQKNLTRNIERLLKDIGTTVTTADLDFYQIGLAWAVFTEPLDDLKVAYWFIKFKLTQINKTQLKITTHEIKFQ